jgi:hypothetical protein
MFCQKPLQLNLALSALLILAAGTAVYAGEPPTSAIKAESIAEAAAEDNIKCVDPTACCEESKKVIDIVNKLVSAYAKGDLATYERFVDEKCTLLDEGTHKMTIGKQAVLEHLRESFAEHAPGGPKPLVSLTIDQPYAKVHDERCVVTFVATLKTGGAHPVTERANVTDVFVKRNGEWKKSYWRGRWEVVKEIVHEDKKS